MDPLAAYASLFAASFLAATVFPFQSELILVGLVASDEFPWWALLIVATSGNTLGSMVNWLLGSASDIIGHWRALAIPMSANAFPATHDSLP